MRANGKRTAAASSSYRSLVVLVLAAAAAAVALLWLRGSTSPAAVGLSSSSTATSDEQKAAQLFASLNPAFNLRRSAAAILLEYNISADPAAGLCHDQRCLLPEVPDRVCQNLRCMWSDAAGTNVDLWLQPLRPLPGGEFTCPRAAGGQAALKLPSGRPVISFVITMHNSAEVTAQCLLELFRTAHEVDSAEFILVDDGSTEDVSIVLETVERLQLLFGAEVVHMRNEKALGYGQANAKGIEAARGEYVALINNDMFVVKGWLTAILETFRLRPKAGMVGPLFLGRNNIVQEAGGIVFNDASAANYARGKTLNHWINYLRVADYISAACIVFRKELFVQLGGFDVRYERGYYEDTDLALSVASAGYEVLFQPLAVVYHQEGTTFGTDQDSELKRSLMAKNKETFLGKWHATLQDSHCPAKAGNRASAMRSTSPKLLWVDDIVPEPDRDSGSIRAMNMLRILLDEGFHVTFAPLAWRNPAYSAFNRLRGVHVIPAIHPLKWANETEFLRPGECGMYDAILVARRGIYQKVRDVLAGACPGVPIIYDTVDLHFLREARDVITSLSTAGKSGEEAWDFSKVGPAQVVQWLDSAAPETEAVREKRDAELELIDNSQAIVVVSGDEIEVIQHYRPNATVLVVSNIHDVPEQRPTSCEGRSGLLFIGNMNHRPNCQAIQALLEQVLPHLGQLLPQEYQRDFMIHVVGANVVPDELHKLIEEHKEFVTFHGYMPDDELAILYRRVRVVVAPLLSGAGVKGKVNQAMKQGVPIVSTPLGVEGMHVRDGVDGLVAHTPQEFAAKVVRAYTDCKLWQRLALGGYENIKRWFSIDAARPAVLETLRHVGATAHPADLGKRCGLAKTEAAEVAAAGAVDVAQQHAQVAAAAAQQQQQQVAAVAVEQQSQQQQVLAAATQQQQAAAAQ